MRIALVTHYYPAHRGGIEIVAGEIARRLAATHGAGVDWHASDCDPAPSIPGVACTPARSWNGVERGLGLPYPLWSRAALRRLREAARAADAVHLHDCLYLPNLAAYDAARRAGRPVLVTQHVGMIPYRNPALRGVLSAAYHGVARRVLEGAAQVVFISATVQRYFESFVRFRSPPLLVPNGVDTSIFRPAARPARGEAPVLLFVGRFVEKKGLPMLRALAARLPHARWVFAGWGPLDPGQWGLANVTVVRGRSGAELASLYQAADLLVLPSVGEGFPLVVQEAMACGTPALIGSETAAGLPEAAGVLLSEHTGGADAVQRWEARIRALTAQAGPLEDLRSRAAAYAAAHWSWDKCAAAYAQLLRRCTAK
jgi:glycosyltransferase involved in cell wall biosynthesis